MDFCCRAVFAVSRQKGEGAQFYSRSFPQAEGVQFHSRPLPLREGVGGGVCTLGTVKGAHS